MASGRGQKDARREPVVRQGPDVRVRADAAGRQARAPRQAAAQAREAAKQASAPQALADRTRRIYWALVLALVARDRRRRHRGLWSARICRRSSRWKFRSARPRSRSSTCDGHAAGDARRHGRRTAGAEGTAALSCRKPSSPSRIGASTSITASIRSASRARWSPTSCTAASRRAAPPSPSSSPRICF